MDDKKVVITDNTSDGPQENCINFHPSAEEVTGFGISVTGIAIGAAPAIAKALGAHIPKPIVIAGGVFGATAVVLGGIALCHSSFWSRLCLNTIKKMPECLASCETAPDSAKTITEDSPLLNDDKSSVNNV
jgi:hypothetical protein